MLGIDHKWGAIVTVIVISALFSSNGAHSSGIVSVFSDDKKSNSLLSSADNSLAAIDIREVSGTGMGNIACTDGKQIRNGHISFIAIEKNLPILGSWEIVSNESSTLFNKAGSFQSGTISSDAYNLIGSKTSDNICFGDRTSTITISGECGEQVKIDIQAKDGEKGTFLGDVTCLVASASSSGIASSQKASASAAIP
jgi:hypothetical protein